MSIEDCRRSQHECSAAVRGDMTALRREVQSDIATIRTAVQDIDRSVASIKGYLGINGNAPRHHRRQEDDEEREHRRSTDDWRVKLMWGGGIFIVSVVINRVMTMVLDHIIPVAP